MQQITITDLRKPGRDNPIIGILIYKSKNNTLAQYALEGSNLPSPSRSTAFSSSIQKT